MFTWMGSGSAAELATTRFIGRSVAGSGSPLGADAATSRISCALDAADGGAATFCSCCFLPEKKPDIPVAAAEDLRTFFMMARRWGWLVGE